jgi:hypothetical protein
VPPEQLRIPTSLRPQVEQILQITDAFCAKHLDGEYAVLCRKLTGRLARKRPSPLARGDLRIWAAAVVATVGYVNFLYDPAQSPHLSADQLSELLGVRKTTMANKSKLIRDLLGIERMEVELCRREVLAQHPLARLVEANGLLVDIWSMPPEIQAEARRRGLVLDVPPTPQA